MIVDLVYWIRVSIGHTWIPLEWSNDIACHPSPIEIRRLRNHPFPINSRFHHPRIKCQVPLDDTIRSIRIFVAPSNDSSTYFLSPVSCYTFPLTPWRFAWHDFQKREICIVFRYIIARRASGLAYSYCFCGLGQEGFRRMGFDHDCLRWWTDGWRAWVIPDTLLVRLSGIKRICEGRSDLADPFPTERVYYHLSRFFFSIFTCI